MSRVKSTNEYASFQAGFDSQWLHISAGATGRTTISPRLNEQVTLGKIILNTAGTTTPITLSDSVNGMIASINESTNPTHLPYSIATKTNASLYIDNGGGADLTIVFKNH